MAELAFYPAVALLYFFGVMRATQEDRVQLDQRASLNVFCLFVLAQPLCLALGPRAGMAAYLLAALLSYSLLPWRGATEPPAGGEGPGRKSKKKTK